MTQIEYREASLADVPAMARIRTAEWGTEENWVNRIGGYLDSELHPQQALLPRIGYLACDDKNVIGLITGHLTKRFGCDGELQWINILPGYRGKGIASALLRLLAEWFVQQNAFKICVDPGNENARKFYYSHGAENLNQHWMFWKNIESILKK